MLICTNVFMASCIGDNNSASSQTEQEIVLSDETVVDASGTVLNIPTNPENAKIASVYGVSVPFIVALGLSDNVVAINTKSIIWNDNIPAFKNIASVGQGTIDYEKLAGVNPTVVIHRANDPTSVEGVDRLKIPVITIQAELFDSIYSTIDLLATYFGAQERAVEVKSWIDERMSLIDSIVSDIPDDEKVSALCMGSTLTRVAGEDMLQTEMIIRAGGKSVVSGVKNFNSWSNLGTEKIFAMNPDIIFFTSSSVLEYNPEDLLSSPTWQSLDAVGNGKLYSIPAKIDSWDIPGISCVLGTFYMLHVMYPERFSKADLQKQIDDYYNFMFGRTFDAKYLGYELT